ncbi:hypothetical protein DFJ73DRAFT_781435 [Zopfochytrium polystomum]|nr:hypothetical protein DFJ73DRAFT_781435 [Zopfochytrium polystomum]
MPAVEGNKKEYGLESQGVVRWRCLTTLPVTASARICVDGIGYGMSGESCEAGWVQQFSGKHSVQTLALMQPPHPPPVIAAVVLDYLSDFRDRFHFATLYQLKHHQAATLVKLYDRGHNDDKGSNDDVDNNENNKNNGSDHNLEVQEANNRRHATLAAASDNERRRRYALSAAVPSSGTAVAAAAITTADASATTILPATPSPPLSQRFDPRPTMNHQPNRHPIRGRCVMEAASARRDPAMLDCLLTYGRSQLAIVDCGWVEGGGRINRLRRRRR